MARFSVAAAAALGLLILAFAASCGGSSNTQKTPTATSAASASAGAASDQAGQPGLPVATPAEQAIPTPTALPDAGIVLTVRAGAASFLPKRSEIAALPTTELKAGDKSFSGITLQAFADKVQAKPASFVRISGVRDDGKRMGFVQGTLGDIGNTTLFVIDSTGHLSLVSSTLSSDQWVTAVESIIFQ